MTFALSSFGRTRRIFFLFLLILFLSQFQQSAHTENSLLDEGRGVIQNIPLPDSRVSSEEQKLDSFNVHPLNRWDITNDGFSELMDDGLFRMSDTGDGTTDSYLLLRDLDSIEGEIRVRFKYTAGGTNSSSNTDGFEIQIRSKITGNWIKFNIARPYSEDITTLAYDSDGSVSINLDDDEETRRDLWYILRMNYNLLESTFRFRLYFDNQTKCFDHNWQDISSSRPDIFGDESSLELFIRSRSRTSGCLARYYIDYVEAPYKERKWEQVETPSDSNYLTDEWFGGYCQDDIDDQSRYRITAPYLDLVSGVLLGNCENPGSLTSDDEVRVHFRIFGVEANNGTLRELMEISYSYGEDVTVLMGLGSQAYCYTDTTTQVFLKEFIIGSDDQPALGFEIGTTDERQNLSGSFHYDLDIITGDFAYDMSAEVDISEIVDYPSQEFVLEVEYDFDFVYDTEFYAGIDKFELKVKDLWSDIKGFVGDLRGALNPFSGGGGGDILSFVVLWAVGILKKVFETVGELIVAAVNALEPLFTVISNAIGEISGWLTTLGTNITNAIAAIAAAIWTALGPVLQDLTEDIIEFLSGFVDIIIIFLATLVFWLWNALNLPDVLSWIEFGLDYFISFSGWLLETANKNVTLMIDLSWLILVGWWVWAIPIQWARAGFDPIGGLGNFIDAYFNNIIPIDIFGFHFEVPQGIVFTLWLITILPDNFALFTAMS